MMGGRRLVDFLSYCFRIVWDEKKQREEVSALSWFFLSTFVCLPSLVVGMRLLSSVMIVSSSIVKKFLNIFASSDFSFECI
jgi:uncharacterized BrkB/YihY/UPF0761 family membrane protein